MIRPIFSLLTAACLTASIASCHSQNQDQKTQSASVPKDEVRLGPPSPKHGYIKESVVDLTQRPLMEPVAG